MRPEQDKAREYLQRRGTLLASREVFERVRAAFLATEEFLGGVEEAQARVRPASGGWSVQEVLDHLVESHRPGVGELRCLLRGERPLDGPIPAGLQSAAPLEHSWSGLVAELERLHREILEVLAGVPDGCASEARAPVVMVVNARKPDGGLGPIDWIEEVDWKAYAVIFRLHEIDHLGQARRVLREISDT